MPTEKETHRAGSTDTTTAIKVTNVAECVYSGPPPAPGIGQSELAEKSILYLREKSQTRETEIKFEYDNRSDGRRLAQKSLSSFRPSPAAVFD